MEPVFPGDDKRSQMPDKVKMTTEEYAEALTQTYRSILIFKLIGIGIVSIVSILLIYDFRQFFELGLWMFPLGSFLVWMTFKMKKDTDKHGISRYRNRLILEDINSNEEETWSHRRTTEKKPLLDIDLPKRIEIQRFDDYLQINRKWFSYEAIFIIAFSLSFFMLVISLLKNREFMGALLLGAVILGLFYYGLAKLLNTTRIMVSKHVLQVRHTPLPWSGNQRIATGDIRQIYTKRYITKNKNGNEKRIYFNVLLINQEEDEKILIQNLDSREQALFIEAQIENYLDIKNLRVRQEVGYSDFYQDVR